MLKQYCLEGILAKESSPRTKDLLLWSDFPNQIHFCLGIGIGLGIGLGIGFG